MKILQIINSLAGGGAEKLVAQLSVYLNNNENICELLILTDKNDKYLNFVSSNGVKVIISPYQSLYDLRNLRFIYKIIKRRHYDIVHAHLFPILYYVSVTARLLFNQKTTKYIFTEHNTFNRRRQKLYLRGFEKFIYNSYGKIISISGATRENLCKWLKKYDNSVFSIIYNGGDLSGIDSARAYSKKDFCNNNENDTVLLGMTGSFTEQKNHAFIVDVLKELPQSFHLVLVGEGALMDNIKELVSQYSLGSRVDFLGYRQDAVSIMKAMDIIVIPSKWEGFGLIAVEAMRCGVPVVASDVPGLSDVVGDSGLLFNVNDKNACIECILQLLNPELYRQLAERGLERSEKFSFDIMADKYMDIYKSVVGLGTVSE